MENMYINLYPLRASIYIANVITNPPSSTSDVHDFFSPSQLKAHHYLFFPPTTPSSYSFHGLLELHHWHYWLAYSLSLLQKLKKKKNFLDSQSHAPFFLLFSISSSKQLLCVLYFSCYLFAGNITAILLYASPM